MSALEYRICLKPTRKREKPLNNSHYPQMGASNIKELKSLLRQLFLDLCKVKTIFTFARERCTLISVDETCEGSKVCKKTVRTLNII